MSEQRCMWCKQLKHEHVTWPARADYFQCPRETAPFVGCTFSPERQSNNHEAVQHAATGEE